MTKDGYKKRIKKSMENLGTYKSEFDMLIETMATIMSLRDANLEEWEKENMAQVAIFTNTAGASNVQKSPYFINNLQYNEQILKYGKALGLTPDGAKNLGALVSEPEFNLDEYSD